MASAQRDQLCDDQPDSTAWWGAHFRDATRSGVAVALVAGALLFLLGATPSLANPCVVPDNGTGTVDVPPSCPYTGVGGAVFNIVDGLPAGTTLELEPILTSWICGGVAACTVANPPGQCEAPGGGLGGTVSCSTATMQWLVTGTGSLAGYSRTINLPVVAEILAGPRNPGDPVQLFASEIYRLDGDLFGDPDFDFLTLRIGTANGLPNVGEMIFSDAGASQFNVDSFFDVQYRIEFQGAPGSVLEGFVGVTTDTIALRAGEPAAPVNECVIPDDGSGTGVLPPAGCEYISPEETYLIIDGLPPGSTIELSPVHFGFQCDTGAAGGCSVSMPANTCEVPGGSLGGRISCATSTVELAVSGTGSLAGFERTLQLPLAWEAHSAPRQPGDPVQSFSAEMMSLQGPLFGDPDFCQLDLTAGTFNGLVSPGQSVLSRTPAGDFNVDSFFDVSYEIDFVGCPGSVLDGLAGKTNGVIRIETGEVYASAIPGLTGPGPWILAGVMTLTAAGYLVLERRRRSGEVG
jgi:hypothetical protein